MYFKSLLIHLIVLCTAQLAYSQDIIYKKDGSRIDTKIIKIQQEEIWYKKWNYQDGPEISILKSDVLLIQYANGETEVFQTEKTNNIESPKIEKTELNELDYDYNSILALNPVALLNSNISFSYERFFSNGRHSFRLPIYYGFKYGTYLFQPELRTYSKSNKPIKYFISPMARVGTYPRFNNSQTSYLGNRLIIGGILNNGIYIQSRKSFNIALELGLGFGWTTYGVILQTNLGLNFGWRF